VNHRGQAAEVPAVKINRGDFECNGDVSPTTSEKPLTRVESLVQSVHGGNASEANRDA
jgi:hypothetical protein